MGSGSCEPHMGGLHTWVCQDLQRKLCALLCYAQLFSPASQAVKQNCTYNCHLVFVLHRCFPCSAFLFIHACSELTRV
jgi:hypothetical protein